MSTGKRILVTGGAGFIGSHTVVELVNAGYTPVIIDNFSNSEKSVLEGLKTITGQDIECHEGDFQDTALLATVLGSGIDGVIHFAAAKAVGESVASPLKYYKNNVAGFVTLLEALLEHTIPSIVFSSSCTVYGEPDQVPVDENAAVKPASSPYGSTKQMDELILRDTTAASELRGMALRYFNPVGAHESALIGELPIGIPANLIPFVTQTAAGHRESLTVFGNDYDTPDGTCIRDYIHVVDLAKAHIKALEYISAQEPGFYDTCNVGTGVGSSIMDVIKTFEQVSGVKLRYTVGSRREGDLVSTYASTAKANEVLGWKAEKTLADALADAWRWQQHLDNQA